MKKWLPILCMVLLASCQKSNDSDEPTTPPEEAIRITLATTEVTPGDPVEIKVNKKVPAGETTITFNSTPVKGYATGDSAFTFLVPVVAPGKVTVSVPALTGANTAELTVKNYTPIDRPEDVFAEFAQKRQQSIDSLTKSSNGPLFQPSAATLTLLDQLKEEWALQVGKLSAADKQLLAYTLRKHMPDPAASSFTPLDAANYARLAGAQGDVGDQLVALAKTYVTAQVVCVASIPVTALSLRVFLKAPNALTGSIFLVAFTTYIISREVSIRRAGETARMKGVVEFITGASAQKTAAVEFLNNSERALSMSVSLRNLNASDAGIQPDISKAFSGEQTFASEDKELEGLYGQATAFFEKLKGTYPAYAPVIGKLAKGTRTQEVEGDRIVVKSVSDSRISFTSSLSGTTRKVKITSTATTPFDFTLKVAYVRGLDNQEFTRDIACSYNPNQYNYKLQLGDYHPDYTKVSAVQTLGKGDALTVHNYVQRLVRLTLDGVPVKVGSFGLDWTPLVFGTVPTSATDIKNPEYPVTVYDATNQRSVTIMVNATLLNTAYAAIIGKTITVDYYQNNSKVGTTTFTYHADGTLTRAGTFPSTGTYSWIVTQSPSYDQCTSGFLKDEFAGAVTMGGGDIFTPGYLMIRSDGSFRANSSYGCTDRWERYDIR